ncbi:hypothetical protein [Pseudomonas sp. PNPG3]|uniref:hypothetical protein n=1 Tax=Pseudomonas sp. PNPG3 TaxID=2919497 RepID=UPI001FFCD797|nr:hypothetical protein [Pseudomonas sp. PNPG3]MCK2122062.1 hypothetical protein [Pseudomonas sp. PNPG3]
MDITVSAVHGFTHRIHFEAQVLAAFLAALVVVFQARKPQFSDVYDVSLVHDALICRVDIAN